MTMLITFVVVCDAEKCTADDGGSAVLELVDARDIGDAMIDAEKAGWQYLCDGGFVCPACLARANAALQESPP